MYYCERTNRYIYFVDSKNKWWLSKKKRFINNEPSGFLHSTTEKFSCDASNWKYWNGKKWVRGNKMNLSINKANENEIHLNIELF